MAASRPQSPAKQNHTTTSRLPVKSGAPLPATPFLRPTSPQHPATPTTPVIPHTASPTTLPRPSSPLKAPFAPTSQLEPRNPHDSRHGALPRHRAERITLLSLPQELQDIIFHYAYPVPTDVDYVCATVGELRQDTRSATGKRTDARPALTPLVTTFMVSKAFFNVAAKAFVTNHGNSALTRLCAVSSPESIVSNYATSLEFRWNRYWGVYDLSNLKNLIIEVEVQLFDKECSKVVLNEKLHGSDLKSMPIFDTLNQHPTLQRLELRPVAPDRNYPTSFFWLRDVKALETLINTALLQNKSPKEYFDQDIEREHRQIELGSVARGSEDRDIALSTSTGSFPPSSNVEMPEDNRHDLLGPSSELPDAERNVCQLSRAAGHSDLPPPVQEASATYCVSPELVPLSAQDDDDLQDLAAPSYVGVRPSNDVGDILPVAAGRPENLMVDASDQTAQGTIGGGRADVPNLDCSQPAPVGETRRATVHLPLRYVDAATQTHWNDTDQWDMRSATADSVLIEQQSFTEHNLLLGIVMKDVIAAVIVITMLLAVWLVVNKEI
ncbi:hypothetical protein LTR86_004916 [Recurvomyces mirabilis]|nr:hypothetical protein LTR86_004916 [Recurvomyces mirabilis]